MKTARILLLGLVLAVSSSFVSCVSMPGTGSGYSIDDAAVRGAQDRAFRPMGY